MKGSSSQEVKVKVENGDSGAFFMVENDSEAERETPAIASRITIVHIMGGLCCRAVE